MKYLTFTSIAISLSLSMQAQKIILIKDSIMNAYMESGFATKHFRPDGKTDKQHLRQGKWKDYEVVEEGSYQLKAGAPMKTTAKYLLYGEGQFIDDKRSGDWHIYVLEDKSFKKILSRELSYESGIPTGPFSYYYPDGKVAQTGKYVDGKIEGEASILYPDGAVFGKQLFKAGKKDGLQQYFFPDGKLHFFIHYNKGLQEGSYEAYYKNGQKEETITYAADSIDGVYRYYYPSGKLWTEKIYDKGLLMNITATFDKNGQPLDKGSLTNGNGFINYYTEEGKIYSIVTYKDGVKIKEEER